MTTVLETPAGAGLLASDEQRIEGREKVSGQARYAGDFTMQGMLWAAFLTSPTPHARIASLDVSAARAMKGVHAVLTAKDIGEKYFGRRLFDWPVLAIDRVRFIGDYVAAVAAETPQIAEAAVAAIDVEYDELPALFGVDEALADGAPILHEHPERYAFLGPPKRKPIPHLNVQGFEKSEKGDLDAGFAAADRIVEGTYSTPRMFPGYIEPRAALVWIDENDVAHVISTTKSPFLLQNQLALSSGLPKEKFVVEPCWIGGDFGAKGLSVEEFHCYYLARATGRPVKHVRTYLDDMQATCVRHASKTTVRAGVKRDGTLTAIQIKIVFDGGAYAAGKIVPNVLPGRIPKTPYAVPNAKIERMAVYTNTVPGGFLRAPGDVQILFALESHLDVVAHEAGIDPLELRLRNAMRPGDPDLDGHPHQDANGVAILKALHEHTDWKRKRESGRGHGIAFIARHIGGGKTSVKMKLDAGRLEVATGNPDVGMGVLTVVQRVVAHALEVEPVRIRVRRGSTAEVPVDPGVGGSRSTHIVGDAALDAALQLRRRLEGLGYPNKSWDETTAALQQDGPVEFVGTYDGAESEHEPEWTDVSLYYVDLSVDSATGALAIHDVLLIIDSGTVINPVGYRGQINGGFVFGIGHALTEELRVEGGKIANLNLGDYKLPTQMETPPFRWVSVKAQRGPGPFGAKMVGELTTAGVAPAIANAVADAIGVRISDLPITAERIFEAMHT